MPKSDSSKSRLNLMPWRFLISLKIFPFSTIRIDKPFSLVRNQTSGYLATMSLTAEKYGILPQTSGYFPMEFSRKHCFITLMEQPSLLFLIIVEWDHHWNSAAMQSVQTVRLDKVPFFSERSNIHSYLGSGEFYQSSVQLLGKKGKF